MGKFISLLLLLLLLAACDASAPPVDLYEAEAMVKRARAQTEEAGQVTREAIAQETRQAAITREASIYEIQLIDKQIESTAIAYSLGATVAAGTAQVESARATEQAATIGTATAWPQTAVPLQATEKAIIARAEYEDARATLQPAGLLVGFLFTIGIIGWVIVTLVKALTLRNVVAVTPMGIVSLLPEPRMLAALPQVIDAPVHEVPTAPRIKVQPRPPVDERLVMALRLVNDAIKVAGQNTDQLPGWRRLPGWTSGPWQSVKNQLEAAGLVYSLPSEGTYVREGDLGNLLYELQTGSIHLSPARG